MSTGLCSTFSFIQFCSDSGKVLYIVITVWAQMSKSMARKFVSISFSLLTLWRLSMDWQQGGDDTPCEWFSGGGWSLSAHGMAWWVIPLPSQPLFNLRLPPSHCQNWGNSVTTKKPGIFRHMAHNSFYPHFQGSIGFNTVNPSLSTGKDEGKSQEQLLLV